jgi:hypothetical protein
MPVVAYVGRTGGVELSWDITDSSASGVTEFEVFVSTNPDVTGTTVSYAYLVWRGYATKVLVPAEIGDVLYFQVRGHDAGGRVTASNRTFKYTFNGPSAPPVPQNVRSYSGFVRNDGSGSSSNLVNSTYMVNMSSFASTKLNRPFIEVTWGWEGQGGAWIVDGSFNVASAGLSMADDTGGTASLVGWYLVFQAYSDLSQYHRITGSTLGTINCALISGYNYSADHSGKFWVTPGADSYDVEMTVVQSPYITPQTSTGGGMVIAAPVIPNDPVTGVAIKHTARVSLASSPTLMRYRFDNPALGYAYQAKVVSVGRSGQRSSASTSRTVLAGAAAQLQMPRVQYSINGTRVSFRWTKLANALLYEAAYTTDGTEPSFTSDSNSDSVILYCQQSRATINVQAGDVLRIKFRAVDMYGQVSYNEIYLSVSIGIPAGYYGLTPYNVSVDITASQATGTTSGITEYLVDFPFAFTVRYLSVYAESAVLVTGSSIPISVFPLGEPNSESHISLDWTIDSVYRTNRESGVVSVRADGAVTLRIDCSGLAGTPRFKGVLTLWYEQADITPPYSGGGGGLDGISPSTTANVRQAGSWSLST